MYDKNFLYGPLAIYFCQNESFSIGLHLVFKKTLQIDTLSTAPTCLRTNDYCWYSTLPKCPFIEDVCWRIGVESFVKEGSCRKWCHRIVQPIDFQSNISTRITYVYTYTNTQRIYHIYIYMYVCIYVCIHDDLKKRLQN